MNKKSKIFYLNVIPAKCSLSIYLIIYFIILWLTVNTIGTLANSEPNENFLSEGKNIKSETKLCDSESITISIASLNGFSSKKSDEVEPSFKYLQMLKMILFDTEHDEEDVVEILRKHYINNGTMLSIVNEFEQDYDQHSPIWWYTRECFLSSIINQALQTMNMKILIKMGLFLRDICQQIEEFHTQKSKSLDSLTVYRCLKLSTSNLNKLKQNKDAFMSFNSFLLTSIDRELAIEVCSTSQKNIEILPVLFEIEIEDTASKFTPFVWLDHLSYNPNSQKDILFSMSSIFRITEMLKNERNFWQVQLIGINDNDSSLGFDIELMRLETSRKKSWDKLGHLMISMNELKPAEELYKVLLESMDAGNEKEMILLYDTLGSIKFKNGSYEEASLFFESKLQIQQNSLAPNHSDLVSTYTTIGITNSKLGKLEIALSSYQKALEIQGTILPSNHPNLAVIYDNIGVVNEKMGNYLTALSFHEKALQINEKVLPSYHPDLAINYNNIASIYKFLGNDLKAVLFFQKAVQISEIILKPDDPDLATIYDNIGGVYSDMEQYENALLFYEKAVQINEKVLHSNHPELAYSYSSIGNIKLKMREYSDAILLHQKALEIRQVSLPPNHPSIAKSCIDIGDVYYDMIQFSNARSFYEKALRIQEISLPPNHSDFVFTYIKLGKLYYTSGKYSTALSYFERGLEMGEVSLPESHAWMKVLRHYIAIMEKEL